MRKVTAKRNPFLQDREWLRQRYEDAKLSSVEIAKQLGVRATTVLKALDRHGIKSRGLSGGAKNRRRRFRADHLNNAEWLKTKYVDNHLNTYEIANLVGTNQHSVYSALLKHGIQPRNVSEAALLHDYKSSYAQLNDRNWLYDHYVTYPKASRGAFLAFLGNEYFCVLVGDKIWLTSSVKIINVPIVVQFC